MDIPGHSTAEHSAGQGAPGTAAAILAIALACLLPLRAQAPAPEPRPTAALGSSPALNWVLPLFTDREGYRSMTLRGSAVKPDGPDKIAVTDLSITVFSGDAAARVETVLLSVDATFHPKQNRATGTQSVRVIHGAIEVTGEDWSYDHAGKRVSINKNVRVVYGLPLKLPL